MNDGFKYTTHLLDGDTIYCGMDVVDTIESRQCDSGIAIVNQGGNMHYVAVRYVKDINLCNCPDCIANSPKLEPKVQHELGVMVHTLINMGVNCTNNFM
jgi:hypothetical protein